MIPTFIPDRPRIVARFATVCGLPCVLLRAHDGFQTSVVLLAEDSDPEELLSAAFGRDVALAMTEDQRQAAADWLTAGAAAQMVMHHTEAAGLAPDFLPGRPKLVNRFVSADGVPLAVLFGDNGTELVATNEKDDTQLCMRVRSIVIADPVGS